MSSQHIDSVISNCKRHADYDTSSDDIDSLAAKVAKTFPLTLQPNDGKQVTTEQHE